MSWRSRPAALLVAREVGERTRTTAFRLTTLLLVVGAALGVALPGLVGDDDDRPRVRIAVTRDVPSATAAAVRDLRLSDGDGEIRLEVAVASDAATDRLADGSLDLVVEPDRLLVGRGSPSPAEAITIAAVSEVVRLRAALDEAGLSGAAVDDVVGAPPPDLVRVGGSGGGEVADDDQFALAFIGSVVLYMLLIFYGQMVAGGVNEEKSSRVVELLLATVSPRQLLTAKVTGIGLVGALQVGAAAVAAGATAVATGADLPAGSAATVLGYVVWFVLGYALYCTLFAAAGALTSRSEDAQQAATPLHVLLAVAYGIVISATNDPDSTLSVVASFVPFTAPLAMPVRAALGDVAPVEVVASMALCVATSLVALRVAARVYDGAVLRFGERVRVRQALRRS